MNSRERVKRAVSFAKPDKIPVTLPGNWGNDILDVGFGPNPSFKPSVPGEDEWHCVWEKVSQDDKTMGQVKIHPLNDYSMLDDFDFPNFGIEERYAHLHEIVKKNNEGENPKFVLGSNPTTLGHRPEYLRGSENAWTDPYENPAEYRKLLEILTKLGEDVIDNYAKIGGVDGIMLYDDWGFQDRSMISPELFDEFCVPMFSRLFKRAHDNGMMAFMHSCGHITEFMELLIKTKLDVIQMDQQENMGVDLLSGKFGGRICFWCPVDIQQTMIKGTIEDIENYAKNMIDKFGGFNGGFIGKWYPSPDAVNHSEEKVNAMCRVFTEYGGEFYTKK
ncbi:MAG: hypothetical protein FWG34_09615 [Oscillospiraceae bacterium]|nr:hypothetical protein [Oscillospiraceae bacterium]